MSKPYEPTRATTKLLARLDKAAAKATATRATADDARAAYQDTLQACRDAKIPVSALARHLGTDRKAIYAGTVRRPDRVKTTPRHTPAAEPAADTATPASTVEGAAAPRRRGRRPAVQDAA